MLFFEPLFLFYVFPALLLFQFALWRNQSARKVTLVLASFAFYCWGEPRFIPVVIVSTLIDYLIAPRILADRESGRSRSPWLVLGVAQNLAILVFYKYIDFAIANLNLAGAGLKPLQIALPIGVSFIVFEKISYLVDVHRGVARPARSWLDYGLFVLFFPKLLAGPIIKYHDLDAQIAQPGQLTAADAFAGFERFARGMVKKVLIADPLGAFADQAFTPGLEIDTPRAWLGLICFTLQIYFDFSAYSDMAIGLARMLGFRLLENFNMPYIATSITEFWRRWHISLTTWIRDYLYVPLGGSRHSAARTYFNLWICFLLSGLWHGAAWPYVLWGAYNGFFLMLDRLFLLRVFGRLNVYVANAITLLIVMFGWAIFRSPSLEHMRWFLGKLFDPFAPPVTSLLVITDEVVFTSVVAAALCLVPRLAFYPALARCYAESPMLRNMVTVAIMLLFALAIMRTVATPFKPFIYFRF
jgi:alginate O-acetyltransferase complex protein AlgI